MAEMAIDIAFSVFSGQIIHLSDMESKAINPPLQSTFAKNLPFIQVWGMQRRWMS